MGYIYNTEVVNPCCQRWTFSLNKVGTDLVLRKQSCSQPNIDVTAATRGHDEKIELRRLLFISHENLLAYFHHPFLMEARHGK